MFGSNTFAGKEFSQAYYSNAAGSISGTASGSSTATLAVLQTFVATASAPGSSTATLAVTRVQFITANGAGDSASTLAMLQTFLIAGSAPGDSTVSIAFFTPISATGALLGESTASLSVLDTSGAYGIRVSADGYDVLTDSDLNMVFSSKNGPVKIIAVLILNVTIPASQTTGNSGYTSSGATSSRYQYPIMFINNGTKWIATNSTPEAINDYIGGDVATAGSTMNARVVRSSSSSTYPAAATFTTKTFVIAPQ